MTIKTNFDNVIQRINTLIQKCSDKMEKEDANETRNYDNIKALEKLLSDIQEAPDVIRRGWSTTMSTEGSKDLDQLGGGHNGKIPSLNEVKEDFRNPTFE